MRTLFFILLTILVIALALYIKNKPSIDVQSLEGSSTYTASHWDSVLKGSWHVDEFASGENECWVRRIDIEFSNKHSFQLSGNEEYYTSARPSSTCLQIVSGGGAAGKWYAEQNGFNLPFEECSFHNSKESYAYGEKIAILKCANDVKGLAYGGKPTLNYKSKIDSQNNRQIFISGTNYAMNYTFTCLFQKITD